MAKAYSYNSKRAEKSVRKLMKGIDRYSIKICKKYATGYKVSKAKAKQGNSVLK